MVTDKQEPVKAVHKLFEEIFRYNYSNTTAIAVSSTQRWRLTEKQKEKYTPLNTLWINNNNANATLRVHLDGSSYNYYDVTPNSKLFINAADGIYFTWLDFENLSATTEMAIGDIVWRVGASRLKTKIIPIS